MPPSASRPRICRSNLHSERHILRGFLRPLFLLCAFVPGLFSFTLSAQKRISKQLLDPLVSAILVEGEQCFRIVLETADTREVRVEAEMQGEYQDALLIQTEMLGSTLRISTGFSPHFDLPNDKLGAHKVFSVDLRVILPSHQRVTLFAGTCQVATFGKYQSLKARIDGGYFQMEHMAPGPIARGGGGAGFDGSEKRGYQGGLPAWRGRNGGCPHRGTLLFPGKQPGEYTGASPKLRAAYDWNRIPILAGSNLDG